MTPSRMPQTYTHIFDTPVYKAEVTLNTGCVLVVYAAHMLTLLLVCSSMENG